MLNVDLTTLNIVRTTSAMLMNFCIVNTPRYQNFIWACKVFFLFQQVFTCDNVQGNITDRKLQLLSIFRYQDIPKNGLHSEIISLPHSTTSLKVTWKTIIFLKF